MSAVAEQHRKEPARRSPEAVLRHHGRSFHFASRLLGAHHAARTARLYAFCRYVDDLADEADAPAQAQAELTELRRALVAGHTGHPITADFLALAHDTGMPLEPALALIDGVRWDVAGTAIADEGELLRYAYAVAGTVGVMMCDVLDVDAPAARPHAVDLGIAMQLTNIARDVGEDARAGRRYLPTTWVGPVAPDAIAAPDAALQPELRAAIARTLALAEPYYASGEAGLIYLATRPRCAIRVAARLYHAIGDRIAARGYAGWRDRATVGRGRKCALALAALAAATGHSTPPRHEPALHAPLAPACGVDKRASA
jgi:phytoene synthase